ncbi:hypothetical protein ACHAXN_008515 [Cyclotella atomus]
MNKTILLALELGALLSNAFLVGVHSHETKSKHSLPQRRLFLEPFDNVLDAIKEEQDNGVAFPRLTLQTEMPNLNVDVVLTNPSVTNTTTFSIDGGESKLVKSSSTKFLVADYDITEGSSKNDFAILAIDEENATVKGLVQKDNKLFSWDQRFGEAAAVSNAKIDLPQNWTFRVVKKEQEPVIQATAINDRRRLRGEHTFDSSDTRTLADQPGLEHLNIQSHRREYATDTFPNKYSYQVDLYIEVDSAMVANRDPTDINNMPKTIAYINALITAVSSVFEQEIDTHLHVLHIAKTSIYDTATDLNSTIDKMESTYAGSTWHYSDANGNTPDLHHDLFWRDIGGGRVYICFVPGFTLHHLCQSHLHLIAPQGLQVY